MTCIVTFNKIIPESYSPFLGVIQWIIRLIRYWNHNGSSVTTYDGSYNIYTYHVITNWELRSPVQFSKSGNPSWCQADANAYFINWDFMDQDLATYVNYDDNKASGFPDGSASGECDISVTGEFYYLLGYNSLLQRNY